MAQLPPKVPSTTSPIWPADILHQKDTNNPSWADEFLDFSTSRSGSHRRSMSDSMAFLDSRMVEECRRPSLPISNNNAGDFDRFDDDQLISSMFTDDMEMGPTLSCSSSPSDHNSMNDDEKLGVFDQLQLRPKGEVEEEQSSTCLLKGQNGQLTPTSEDCSEKIFDPKRIKRVLANRQSAQRSRVRKLHYVSELEQSVTSLQAEVSVLSPRVAYLDHQRLVLNVDNSMLKQRIAALAQDKLFKDAHQEALKKEIERLRRIYYQQNQNKIDNTAARTAENYCSAEKEQLAVN